MKKKEYLPIITVIMAVLAAIATIVSSVLAVWAEIGAHEISIDALSTVATIVALGLTLSVTLSILLRRISASLPVERKNNYLAIISALITAGVVLTISAVFYGPLPRPTSNPTPTLVPTTTPTPTLVPTMTPTPTSTLLPAPRLIEPKNGSVVNQGDILRWEAGGLEPDEYYVLTIKFTHEEQTWSNTVWVKETTWTVPDYFGPLHSSSGKYFGSVVIIRQVGIDLSGNPIGEPISKPSEILSFYIPKPPTSMPIRTPTESR